MEVISYILVFNISADINSKLRLLFVSTGVRAIICWSEMFCLHAIQLVMLTCMMIE